MDATLRGAVPAANALYYVLWQWFAVRHLRQRFSPLPFDVVHHVTYVSARYPSFMGSLGIPFFFGPVSGGEGVSPSPSLRILGRSRCREWLRDLSNFLVAFDPLMRHTFRQAERILVTRDTLALIPRRWRHKCEIQLAIGLSDPYLFRLPRQTQAQPPRPHLLYVGRLLEWKGTAIALRAVSRIRHCYPGYASSSPAKDRRRSRLVKLSQGWTGEMVQWAAGEPRQTGGCITAPPICCCFPACVTPAEWWCWKPWRTACPCCVPISGGPGLIVNETLRRCAIATAGQNRSNWPSSSQMLARDPRHARSGGVPRNLGESPSATCSTFGACARDSSCTNQYDPGSRKMTTAFSFAFPARDYRKVLRSREAGH